MISRTRAYSVAAAYTAVVLFSGFIIGVTLAPRVRSVGTPSASDTEEIRAKLNEVIDRVNLMDSELQELQK